MSKVTHHTIHIQGIKYEIPLGWYAVKYKDAVEVIKNFEDKTKVLSILSGIPLEVINKCAVADISKLFAFISFHEALYEFERIDVLPEYESFDFGSIPYADAERCRQFMMDGTTGFEVVVNIIKHLVNIDISEQPFLKVIGTANFFLSNCVTSIVVTPNYQKMITAKFRSTQELSDSKVLAALERMLNSQGQKLSETP